MLKVDCADSASHNFAFPRNGWVPTRRTAYAILATLVATGAFFLLPGTAPSAEPAYAPIGAALILGGLLTIRLWPHERGAGLLLLPVLVAHARFGTAALPALFYASVAANLARGSSPFTSLALTAHDVLAFVSAHLAAQMLGGEALAAAAAFAVVFALSRAVLWRLAMRLRTLDVDNLRAERPDLLVSLALAPLAVLPLLAWRWLGDGAMVLALAALLALLSAVREVANLATARAEVESERDHLRHTNLQVAAERDRLERAAIVQDELLQLITHDLRNPITAVIGYAGLAGLALRRRAFEQLPAYLESIEQGGKSMERLVENLLQLSQLEQADELPPAQPVSLAELTETVLMDLRPLAQQKEQQLTLDVADDIPAALVPPALLREALSNLVSNAIKYTPEGGRVRVSAAAAEEARKVVLQVTDTGIGLSQQDQQRLFTKFFRSEDPRVRRQRGSGLGLALTYSLVERMGGSIAVESQLNQGTTFRLILPTAET